MAAPQNKKNKIISYGKALANGFDIYFAVRLYEDHLNKDREELLNSLSNFLLAQAYYFQFKVEHCGCSCFHCKLRSDCLLVLIK